MRRPGSPRPVPARRAARGGSPGGSSSRSHARIAVAWHQSAARRGEVVPPARLGARRKVGIQRVQEPHAANPQQQHGGRHHQLGADLPPVAGPQVLHGVEGHRLVFDFLGAVPAQHVQHHRIGADRVVGRRIQDPLAQDGGVVLDGGDHGHLLEQPAVPAALAPVGPRSEQLVEQPLDLAGIRGQVDAPRGEVGEHAGVRLGVHRLLPDESLDVEPQLIVFDQRQGLLEHVDEELLARGQQQVQDVEDVGGERLAGHVMERQCRPIEVHVARPRTSRSWSSDASCGPAAWSSTVSIIAPYLGVSDAARCQYSCATKYAEPSVPDFVRPLSRERPGAGRRIPDRCWPAWRGARPG